MGLTPEMIKIIKEEIIPELKNEGIKNNEEFRESDIDMVDLTGTVCMEEFPEEYLEDWMKNEIKELGGDQEQFIHNMVCDWLMDEDW